MIIACNVYIWKSFVVNVCWRQWLCAGIKYSVTGSWIKFGDSNAERSSSVT